MSRRWKRAKKFFYYFDIRSGLPAVRICVAKSMPSDALSDPNLRGDGTDELSHNALAPIGIKAA